MIVSKNFQLFTTLSWPNGTQAKAIYLYSFKEGCVRCVFCSHISPRTPSVQCTQPLGNSTWSKDPANRHSHDKMIWTTKVVSDIRMVSQSASVLLLLFSTPGVWMINFPGSAQGFVFGRQSVFPMESCSTTGIVAKVTLAAGEGRQFQSSNYPSGYGTQISCTYNFEPASGAQLVFSCDDFDLTATSAVGALCTGDYLRFYDSTGSLGSSGDRYCHSTPPSFTYPNNIFVLFKTNNDGTSGRGEFWYLSRYKY